MTKYFSLNDRDFNPLATPSPASHNNTMTLFDQLIVSMSPYVMVVDNEVISEEQASNIEKLIVKAYSILRSRKSFIKHIEAEIAMESN